MKTTSTKQETLIAGYVSMPWTVRIKKNSWGRYLARVDELAGCVGDGETAEEALSSVRESMHVWFATALLKELEIPKPSEDLAFSGKFVVRVPISLHRRLAVQAKEERISLNTLIVTLLSGEAGKTDVMKQVQSCLERAVQPAHEKVSLPRISPMDLLRNTMLASGDQVVELRRTPWENKQKAWEQN
jgi:antitoxin HicB